MADAHVLHIGASTDGGTVLRVTATEPGPDPGPSRIDTEQSALQLHGTHGAPRGVRTPPIVFEVRPAIKTPERPVDNSDTRESFIVVHETGGAVDPDGVGAQAATGAGVPTAVATAAVVTVATAAVATVATAAVATVATAAVVTVANAADGRVGFHGDGEAPMPVPFELWCPPAMAQLAMALYDREQAPAAHALWGAARSAAPALAAHARRSELALLDVEATLLQSARDEPDLELERALGAAKWRYHSRCERAAAALACWSAVTRELCHASVLLGDHARAVKAHLDEECTRLCRCADAATAGGGEAAAESLHWREPLRSIVRLEHESSLRAARAACDAEWRRMPRQPPRHNEAEATRDLPPMNPRSVHIARYMRRSDASFEAAALTAALAIFVAVEGAVGARPPWHL
jgi:hypothetical protein